jgi:hypothetical protein
MDVKKLNTTYPEFTKYLLDHHQTTSPIPLSPSNNNNFLYYNNRTRSIEGVSMLSSFTTLKFTTTKSIQLITVSPQVTPKLFYLPSSRSSLTPFQSHSLSPTSSKTSLLPFFHQFIYTIKVVDDNEQNNFAQKLNEQTIEASRLRASLVRNICSQLDMSATSLRFNWIEKLEKSRFESSEQEQEQMTTNDETDYYNDENNINNEPEFITESVTRKRYAYGEFIFIVSSFISYFFLCHYECLLFLEFKRKITKGLNYVIRKTLFFYPLFKLYVVNAGKTGFFNNFWLITTRGGTLT